MSLYDDDTYFGQIKPLLNLLAQKINPDRYDWCGRYPSDGVIDRCHICMAVLDDSLSFKQVREHGIQHLKDRNLLPFI